MEVDSPMFLNPSSFTFLPGGSLLISNFGNNTISRLGRDGAGDLQLSEFYADDDAPTGMGHLEVHQGVVYAVTGSGKLAALNPDGSLVSEDVWPPAAGSPPAVMVGDAPGGAFGGDLLVGAADGRILRLDTATGVVQQVGDFTFDDTVFGLAVSPLDGALYVAERGGQLWRVAKD